LSTATETDEGRAPSSPLQLSWREWLAVFKRTGKQFVADDCMGLGQQVAFSSLFAFLPAVILLIGLFGLFGDRVFDSLEQFVGTVAPDGVVSIIDIAKQDAARNKSGSAIAFASGLFLALWASTGAMGALIKAVNRAYDRIETRPFWKRRLIALLLVVATGIVLAGVFLLIVFGGDLGNAIVRRTGLGDSFKLFWNLARWPFAFGAVLLFNGLVYHLAPDLPQRSWRWLTPGSLVAALAWVALSGLFALYTSYSGSYSRTYGSIAGAIILLLWLYYSALAILFGAELNAQLERQADIDAAGGPHAGLTRPARR
jgi:membrane protein